MYICVSVDFIRKPYNKIHVTLQDTTSKSLSLSRVIAADQSERLFHLRIRSCRSGWGFMIGRDQRNLPMIRQREDDCPAEKGDV